MTSLMYETTRNRMAADKLQFIAYNLLLDLNLYLYQRAGEEAYNIAAIGETPHSLNGIYLQDWLSAAKNRLKQEGVAAEVEISYLKLSQHTTSNRDAVLMMALGLPLSDTSYMGAIDIDADLNVSLRDVQTGIVFQTFFKLKSLNPVRIYLLSEIATNFCKELQITAPTWTSKTNLNQVAEELGIRFTEFAKNFLKKFSSQAYLSELSYAIHVETVNATQCQLEIILKTLEITDMSNSAYVLIGSHLTHIIYRAPYQKTLWYYAKSNIEGPNKATLSGQLSIS